MTYDDEPGPEGFERVSRDLAKGGTSGRKAFLWLKRHAQQIPRTTSATALDQRRRSSNDTKESGHEAAAAEAAQEEGDNGVLPIGEVVVAFGSSDPNVEEATEAAEQERAAGAVDGAGGEGRGVEERRVVPVWERLDRSLNPSAAVAAEDDGGGQQQQGGGSAVFLWFRRVSEEEPLSWSAHSLTVRQKEMVEERHE